MYSPEIAEDLRRPAEHVISKAIIEEVLRKCHPNHNKRDLPPGYEVVLLDRDYRAGMKDDLKVLARRV